MNILGISCFYHDSSACVIRDGIIRTVVQEERFTRKKYTAEFPTESIAYCLRESNLSMQACDYVVFYEKPFLKFERVILSYLDNYPFSLKHFLKFMPDWFENKLIVPLIIRSVLNYKGKILFISHHFSHAAHAYFTSGFDEAAILTIDGIGEWQTTTYGKARGNKIEILKEIKFPNSLGLFYSTITAYLGFKVNSGEGKTMALAAYGKPVYINKFRNVIDIKDDGSFRLNMKYFSFSRSIQMYSKKFIDEFGPSRKQGEPFVQHHYDVAATAQKILENIVVKMANNLYKQTKIKKLCLSGGTALNCVANGKILQDSPFEEIYIPSSPGDSGTAVGAALYLYHHVLNNKKNNLDSVFLGPGCFSIEIEVFLKNRDIKYTKMEDEELTKYVAGEIKNNKVIGWFQGRMEFGPRALGGRSILANPQNSQMKDILNKKVKLREDFRPFGCSILEEKTPEYILKWTKSPHMMIAGTVKQDKRSLIPAVVHVDGTSRYQTITREKNGLFYDLINEFFKLTGIPLLLNTSFNMKERPMVRDISELFEIFHSSGIDILVIEKYVIEK